MIARLKSFALRVLKLAEALPKTRTGNVIAHQIVRSGTSVAANYRALCRAKSRSDFIYKTSIIEEEADETAFWLELIIDTKLLPAKKVEALLAEVNEITAMIVATRRTTQKRTR